MPTAPIIRSKNFSEVYPYTYTITRKLDGLQYHGVRWGNIRLGLSAVNDLGKKYFSSGIFKKEYKQNPAAFIVKLRWTFNSTVDSMTWESKVNGRIIHRSTWANIAIGKGSADIEKMKRQREFAFMEKYGVNHNFLIESVRKGRDDTIEKIYGVRNVGASKIIRKKVIETSKEKFGVECTFQAPSVKEKIKKSLIKNFGVDNPLKSEEIREKMKQNCIKNFGCEYNFQRPDVKNKINNKRIDMYIKLGKMSNVEFSDYLNSISQKKSVQNQKKTQREKGVKLLEEVNNV